MINDDYFPTISEVAPLLAKRELSAVELTRHCLDRIDRHDASLHAFITLTPERALAAAEHADGEIASGAYRGPLHGIPYALKDVFDTTAVRTTGGSRAFSANVPSKDATVVQRMEHAGAVLLGKSTTHELTYGGVDRATPWPPARNPWDSSRDPGGSSSGSAAAVAAGFCLAALGTDTGGSVRLPAGLCGIAGLKPTYGRVSRRGVMLNSYSLDHCGPMAWTVADCALLLQAIGGHDPDDPASVERSVPNFSAALGRDIRDMRVGVVRHFYERDVPAGAQAQSAMREALDVLRHLGVQLCDVTLRPLQEYAEYKVTIQLPEIFSVYGADVSQRPDEFGPKFRQRIAAGDRVRAVDYVRAQQTRRQMTTEMSEAMADLDALVTCGAYAPAPLLDEVAAEAMRNKPEVTVPFSMTGFPAISICIGFSAEGLPLAMQIAGKPFDEVSVLRIADAYERATPWRAKRPGLHVAAAILG